MKVFLRILIILYISIIFAGCNNKEMSPLLYRETSKVENIANNSDITDLDYTIDNITLSKSYQSTVPNIEVIKNGLDSNLLLSLGLVESSGINIVKVEKNNRDVLIHVSNESEESKKEYVIPQVVLHFSELSSKDLNELNFKIINENYKPIKTNIDIGEAINKIKSSYKIVTSTFPTSNIVKQGDNIFLNLGFTNIANLKDKNSPIVNLNVLVDLINGNIVESNKSSVSSLIDQGTMLGYIPNKYIFYVKEVSKDENKNYSLWVYNIKKDTSEKIYSTKNNITSIRFDEDDDKAFFIESSKDYNKIYLLELEDFKISKLDLNKTINPCLGVWKEKNIVFIDRKDEFSKIYSLDITDSKLEYVAQADKRISQIEYLNGNFLYSVANDKSKDIYITRDFKQNESIDSGEKAIFLDEKTVCYFKNENNSEKNVLWLYDLEDSTARSYTDIDVKDISVWENILVVIEKGKISSNNPVYTYDFKEEKARLIASVKTDKIYLNTESEILYINSSIDAEKEKLPVISSIDLKEKKLLR